MLRNTFLSQARKRRREVEDADGTYAAALVAPAGQESKIAQDEVRALLRAMPKEMRDCILLSVEDGLQYDEIALRLGIALGTVKSRINRVRAMLEKGVATPEDEPEPEVRQGPSDEEVSALFMQGRSILEIAGLTQSDPGAVMAIATRLDLAARRRRKAAKAALAA